MDNLNESIDEAKNLNERFKLSDESENLNQIQNVLELHSNQIFLGMISMQYKAKIVNSYLF